MRGFMYAVSVPGQHNESKSYNQTENRTVISTPTLDLQHLRPADIGKPEINTGPPYTAVPWRFGRGF